MKKNLHRTRVFVPRTVAYLLHEAPNLIAGATHEFCTRDPISFKVCEKMDMFFPKDMVSVVVKTTKTLHAQLKGQLFCKHPLFNLPAPGSLNYEEAVMGMKITCGLEMLCAKTSSDSPAVGYLVSVSLSYSIQYDLKTDPNWTAFIKKLESSGYFENEIKGSSKYASLEKHAEECFLKSQSSQPLVETIFNPLSQISDILKQTLPNDEDISKWPSVCDTDDFLHVTPEELDELMRLQTALSSDDESSTIKKKEQKPLPCKELKSVVEKFEDFIDNENAGPDGIDDESCLFSDTSTDSDISFNEDEFIKLMKETLDISNEQTIEMENDSELKKSLPSPSVLDESAPHELTIQDFIDAMDTELSSTTLKHSFSNLPTDIAGSVEEQNKDINIQYNLLKNIYESIDGQHGAPGPANTLLKSMNLSMPSDSWTSHPSS
ncbi:hypothetical protein PORY_001868 [Pneumocystis oryctolagi]|uniref:Uncharacterized protein n=1 Tax=Pneumocystis oryctolagi TaxID=42067 RepID=A0ACB7CBP5_9ASCO|nr:hypothetical protein PORY_001868 [Pneumocystis oryctolagi]